MKILIIFIWSISIILAGIFLFRALYKALHGKTDEKDSGKHSTDKKNVTLTDDREIANDVITGKEQKISNGVTANGQKKDTGPLVVSDGMSVTIEYSMFDGDGNKLESTNNGPVTYVQGTEESFKQVIPALQEKLKGLAPMASVNVVLPPGDAYGKIDPDAFQEVDKEDIFTDNLIVGSILRDIGLDKKSAKIHEVNESTVVLDFNHPLAGKALSYNVKIIDVKK